MGRFSKIAVFLLINLLGFMAVPVCYHIGVYAGLVSTENPNFDPAAFKGYFLTGTYLTWAVCALFSLSYFFLKGKERLAFLWAPVVVPMAYGLSSLVRLFG